MLYFNDYLYGLFHDFTDQFVMYMQKPQILNRIDERLTALNLQTGYEMEEPVSPQTPSFRLQKYFKRVPAFQLKEELLTILWRSNIEFPVVKVLSFKNQQNTHHPEFSNIQLVLENCCQTLADVLELPMGQLLYLMKESAAGFEALYARIGGFQITKKMIYINKKQKCKVWFSERVEDNVKSNETLHTQKQMLQSFLNVFSERCKTSYITRKFFLGLQKVETWNSLRSEIERFSEAIKIQVSNRFNSNIDQNLSPPSLQQIPKVLHLNLPRKKMPTFLAKMAEKNGASLPSGEPNGISADSPIKTSFQKSSGFSTNYKDNQSPEKNISKAQSYDAIANFERLTMKSDDQRKSNWIRSPESSLSPDTNEQIRDSFAYRSQHFQEVCKMHEKRLESESLICHEVESNSPKKVCRGLFDAEDQTDNQTQHFNLKMLQKNGWSYKLNGLTNQVNTNLALSTHIGDQMSNQMMYSERNLSLLGSLGGNLKTSMIYFEDS